MYHQRYVTILESLNNATINYIQHLAPKLMRRQSQVGKGGVFTYLKVFEETEGNQIENESLTIMQKAANAHLRRRLIIHHYSFHR